MKTGLAAVRERVRPSHLARELGLTRGAITNWRRVPAEWIGRVAELTNLPHEIIRPDLYERSGVPDHIMRAAVHLFALSDWPPEPTTTLCEKFGLSGPDAYRAIGEAERMRSLREADAA